jgi:hypothetical protein
MFIIPYITIVKNENQNQTSYNVYVYFYTIFSYTNLSKYCHNEDKELVYHHKQLPHIVTFHFPLHHP